MLIGPAAVAAAQEPPAPEAAESGAVVEFSADQVTYDSENEIVSAVGRVRMSREGNYLAADRVDWDRRSGQVRASGNVVVVDPRGDKLIGDSVVLTDSLRDGTVDNLLVVLESGGRIAAERGSRADGVITLENAVYSPCPVTSEDGDRQLRGYFEANGKYQLDPLWSVTGVLRWASDKTVTRRYDITRDDRLRNFINAERISPNSYVSIAGWAFQGLRVDDVQKQIPIALPAIDARFKREPPVLGGQVQLQANSLAILRIEGQDTQRAFASARWDRRWLTPLGQQLTLTAYARGDVYHTEEAAETVVPIYRGTDGWHTRAIAALAADAQWPLIGPLFGGIQRVVPRVQVVATPPTPNLSIPNEDARSVDLEDSNLFALNRFPGYDRWEDSSRVTYGLEWFYERPNLSISTTIGQSYRLNRRPGIFPEGTGLTDRLSDIVGRTRIRYGRFIDLTHRYRVDKDNFAVRRNEVDLTIGSDQTYAQIGYLRLNRDIDPTIEDLRDREELRLAGRLKIGRYWSVFGATVLDLTDKDEDAFSLADGWEPVRNRLGVAYEDECLELGLTWRRDYERLGEFRKGSTFALQIALKGLGR